MTNNTDPMPVRPDSTDRHIERLQGEKRMIGLQAKIRSTKNGFLLVRVQDGIPVRWDDVTLSVRNEKLIGL